MNRVVVIILIFISSCYPDRRIAHTPSRKEINKAMSYSSWEYAIPSHK